jgi:predicted ArsR family transcriptional regulator
VKISAPAHDGTRELVARSILENGPSTASVLGERLGLTPAGIRRHLDALLADGIVEAREMRTGAIVGRGRPSKVFVMSDLGRETFEHSYDDLAVSALKFMGNRFGSDSINAFAQSRADEIERKFNSTGQSATSRSLAKFLTSEGYAASVSDKAVGDELCQHHCPIAHVAAEFPQICEAETQVLSRLLGTHVQRLATIAHGDGVCTTFIPSAKKKISKTVSKPTHKAGRGKSR